MRTSHVPGPGRYWDTEMNEPAHCPLKQASAETIHYSVCANSDKKNVQKVLWCTEENKDFCVYTRGGEV